MGEGGSLVLARPQAGQREGEALDINGAWHNTRSNVGAKVVTSGVGDMGAEGSDGALASGLCLDDKAHEGDHSEATILDLTALEAVQVTLCEAKGVKPGVAQLEVRHRVSREDGVRVDTAVVLDVLPPPNLNKVHHKELEGKDTTHVHVREWLGEVLGKASRVEEDIWPDNLGSEDSSGTNHSPASVHQLSLLVPLQSRRLGAKTQRVEATVTGKGSVKVRGGLNIGCPKLPSRSIDNDAGARPDWRRPATRDGLLSALSTDLSRHVVLILVRSRCNNMLNDTE